MFPYLASLTISLKKPFQSHDFPWYLLNRKKKNVYSIFPKILYLTPKNLLLAIKKCVTKHIKLALYNEFESRTQTTSSNSLYIREKKLIRIFKVFRF